MATITLDAIELNELLKSLSASRNDTARRLIAARRKLAAWTDEREAANHGYRAFQQSVIDTMSERLRRITALATRLREAAGGTGRNDPSHDPGGEQPTSD
jgi:hypothetical protein